MLFDTDTVVEALALELGTDAVTDAGTDAGSYVGNGATLVQLMAPALAMSLAPYFTGFVNFAGTSTGFNMLLALAGTGNVLAAALPMYRWLHYITSAN